MGVHQGGLTERNAIIDRAHSLPIVRRYLLLKLTRSSVYDQGERRHEGYQVGRCHVVTLMRRMGIPAVYRKPGTSQRHLAHQSYSYLLCQLAIMGLNHVRSQYHVYSDDTRLLYRSRFLGHACRHK